MTLVLTIVIPTYKRPDSLARLLRSIIADIGDRDDTAIVVADNDAARSAESTVRELARQCDNPIDYRVAPEPGVSNARNAGMEGVKSRYVLFLDDDMAIEPGFVAPMLDTSRSLSAAMTFAPIRAVLPDGMERLSHWLAPLFSRQMRGPTRLIDDPMGTGGCLLDLNGLALPDPIFDPALNEVGGEDDALFAAIQAQGGRAAWCADVTALEYVPPHRATLRYLWARHFAYGQTPARDAAGRGITGLPSVAKWMAVGSVQTLLHGTACLALRLTGRPAYIGQMGKLAQGVGKIFWWDGLSPKFYGAQAR
ncbi:MAG: glycosyltransferase family 2 protein [Pseudomonadota bacterium]